MASIAAPRFTTLATKLQMLASTGSVTFAQARAGGSKVWKLMGTAVQGSSIWNQVFDHAGDEVPVSLRPAGAASPGVGLAGWFNAVAIISIPNGVVLGGDADADPTARFTFDFEFVLKDKPVEVNA